MVYRGVVEWLRAADDAADLADGWAAGRVPVVTPDARVIGAATNAAWAAEHQQQPLWGAGNDA
jgi:hypothetical protein